MARGKSRDLTIRIAGDADKLDREVKRANSSLDKLGKQTRLTSTITSKGFSAMRIGATGAAAGLAGLAFAGKEVTQAAIESEKSQARLAAQLKASGISFQEHRKEIEAVIQKHSQLAGLDDEDLQDAFTNIVRVTGDVSKSLRLTGLAADFARAKQLDVAKAGEIVGKVAGGNIGVLGRYGIKIREGASASEALAALQTKFAGQAEAYGKTTAGSVDRASVAFENLKEEIGGALAPSIEKAADKTAKFVNEMTTGTGQGGKFVDTLSDISDEVRPVVTWLGRAGRNVANFTEKHPEVAKLAATIVGVGVAVKGLKFVSAATGFTDLLKAGRAASRGLKRILASGGTAAGEAAAANAAAGMTAQGGKFQAAGRGLGKRAGKGLLLGVVVGAAAFADDISAFIVKAYASVLRAGGRLGRGIVNGIVKGITASPGEIVGNAINGLVDKVKSLNPFGDGIGKSLRRALPTGGKAANLMGANRALAPIAAVGARFGLAVSSGHRGGAITSSGNTSYHSSGEAVDLAGSSAGMMRTFKALKSAFGSRLAELIYTPGGVGIKNGRPHMYSGQVAADHFDHVHAALDLGKPGPGIGDGIGTAVQAARTAGFSGTDLVNMVAIAGRESGYNAHSQNLKYPDHSIGLWQINQLAHKGRFGTDAALMNPVTNARAARALFKAAGYSPWVGPSGSWTDGITQQMFSAARTAVVGSRGSSASTARSGAATGGGGETAGSRLVNTIAGKYSKSIRAATSRAAAIGGVIEDAEGGYGRSERFFGQVLGGQPGRFGDEDLGTAEGRGQRTTELQELKKLKVQQLARMNKRKAALKRAISASKKQVAALQKARGKAKGAKRAKMGERIRAFEDRLTDLRAELKTLGEASADVALDISDLDKDIAEVQATPDTGAGDVPEAAERVSPTEGMSAALSVIDAKERAGDLTAAQAREDRIALLRKTLAGEFGNLNEAEDRQVRGDLREATAAALAENTQQLSDVAQAVKDLQASIDAQVAQGNAVMASQLGTVWKALADVMSGQIGHLTSGRALLAGDGRNARY